MGNVVHRTIPVQVWADVDEGIAALVRELNEIPGVRTHSSCQGTIGEGGAEPYQPFVSVSWDSDEIRHTLASTYHLKREGNNHGLVYPLEPGANRHQ